MFLALRELRRAYREALAACGVLQALQRLQQRWRSERGTDLGHRIDVVGTGGIHWRSAVQGRVLGQHGAGQLADGGQSLLHGLPGVTEVGAQCHVGGHRLAHVRV